MIYYGMEILKFVERNMNSRKYIDTLDGLSLENNISRFHGQHSPQI